MLGCYKRILACAVFCFAFAPTSSFALTDVLELPALESDLAPTSLLVDVDRAGDRLVAVGERGHIIYSDDSGKSWKQASVPVSVLITAVDFVDRRYGWAVGHSGVILRSTDGGESWERQFDGRAANVMLVEQAENYERELSEQMDALQVKLDNATGRNRITSLEAEVEDLFFRLEDAQFALEDAHQDAEFGAAKPFLDVLFINRTTGFAVGSYGLLFKTVDGGNTWNNYGSRIDNVERLHLNAIAYLNSGDMILVGEAGLMFRSSDRGESWESLYSPYEGSFFGLVELTGDDVVAFGLRGNIYLSKDAGDNWDMLDVDTDQSLMGAAFNGRSQLWLVGNGGTLLVSKDRGQSFSKSNRSDMLDVNAVAFQSQGKVVVVGAGGVRLTSTTDAGL